MKGRKPKLKARSQGSNVTDHEYDPQTGTLTVHFSSGARYAYHNVPKEIADGFSGGAYLHQHIAGKFTSKQLD